MSTDTKKDYVFPDLKSLEWVVHIINEVARALNDKTRITAKGSIPDSLFKALGAATGSAGSLAALYGLGTTGVSAAGITSGLAAAGLGAGMLGGIVVLAIPAVILANLGASLAPDLNDKILQDEKNRLCEEASKQNEALIKAIKEEANSTKERKEYLQSLSVLMAQALRDLKKDLDSNDKE